MYAGPCGVSATIVSRSRSICTPCSECSSSRDCAHAVICRLTMRSSDVVRERTASASSSSASRSTSRSSLADLGLQSLELFVAGVFGGVEVLRDATADVALDVDRVARRSTASSWRSQRIECLIDIAELVATQSAALEQRGSARLSMRGVSRRARSSRRSARPSARSMASGEALRPRQAAARIARSARRCSPGHQPDRGQAAVLLGQLGDVALIGIGELLQGANLLAEVRTSLVSSSSTCRAAGRTRRPTRPPADRHRVVEDRRRIARASARSATSGRSAIRPTSTHSVSRAPARSSPAERSDSAARSRCSAVAARGGAR